MNGDRVKEGAAEPGADSLGLISGLEFSPDSLCAENGAEFGLAWERGKSGSPRLAVLVPADCAAVSAFEGVSSRRGDNTLLLGPLSARNASALRGELSWLRPRRLGTRISAGFGDRLGLATPGHIKALRRVGGEVAPIFAQQSIREMERTGRSPQEVMDDATWGAFAGGWREGFGADADHLKTPADTDACLAAGYTFFTFDPGDHVDDTAEVAGGDLRAAFDALPWNRLEDAASDLERRYLGRDFEYEGNRVAFDEKTLRRAAVKYGRAVAHVAEMYGHLAENADGEFEVEVSVDETSSVTTHAQHVYLALEMRRLGVEWISLAPRYVGTFEKGVDYIGDVDEFERDFAVHAAIARGLGPYKLSLHSGSDKFSVYPAAVRQTDGMIHLKTAGTSYLEALRAVAALDPGLFREVYEFSRGRFEEDRASYHVSAELAKAPSSGELGDAELPGLLEQFDAREILHVTFGSVLLPNDDEGRIRRDQILDLLRENPEIYADCLESHFARHLKPFAAGGGS